MFIRRVSQLSFSTAIHNQIFRTNFNDIFINYKFEDFGLPIIQSFRIILFNPVCYCIVAQLTNLHTALDVFLREISKEKKIDTENMLCP